MPLPSRLVRSVLALAAAVLVLALSSSARAETGAPDASARGPKEHAYLTMSSSLSAIDTGSGTIVLAPVSLELGLIPERRFEVGVSFDYAKSTALSCAECGAQRWRGVARGRAHLFGSDVVVDPWLGGGLGYERLSVPARNATGQDPFGGIDVIMELGIDLHITRGLRFGPRVAAELTVRDPDAPAWAVGFSDTLLPFPAQFEAGVRLGYAL